MANLITLSDFIENKFLTQNLDDSDINPVIEEAQEFDLLPVLGAVLYYDFINGYFGSPQDQKYIDLLNGKTYTPQGFTSPIQFKGVKMVLKYYVYARLMVVDGVKSTNSGFVQKALENSERVSGTQRTQMIAQTRSGAKKYEDDMVFYLNNYSTLFPLWNYSGLRKNKGFGFRMRGV